MDGSQLEWLGSVPSGQAVKITFRMTLPTAIGTIVRASAAINDPNLVSTLVLDNCLQIQAPTGGPDAFGYTYRDSLAPGGGVAFSWVPTTPLST